MINVEYDSFSEITSISINNEKLDSDNGDLWYLPKKFIGNTLVKELPKNVQFELCNRVEDSIIHLDSLPTILTKVDDNKIRFSLEDSGTRKYWDGNIGFKLYMETKRDVVKERNKEIGDINFDSYEDDGAFIHLYYSIEIEAEKLSLAVKLVDQIVSEIEGTSEIRIGSQFWSISENEVESEKEFTLKTVLPIIRKLGFQNVRYNHGKKEFGRDIIFSRITEFQEVEHWGAQVKFGNISGSVNSEIDEIIGQIDDAFKMPFYDLYSKQHQRISKIVIIISGKFTENAIEKICNKIESYVVKNNIVFVDKEKIKTLSELFNSVNFN